MLSQSCSARQHLTCPLEEFSCFEKCNPHFGVGQERCREIIRKLVTVVQTKNDSNFTQSGSRDRGGKKQRELGEVQERVNDTIIYLTCDLEMNIT